MIDCGTTVENHSATSTIHSPQSTIQLLNPIRQLPPALVNRIAAGEVIERPASVVKELLENSLDAGAQSIVVEIEDGGRELIRVIDDGHGISSNDLQLAFASHATSKIIDDNDLFSIQTMGFRGEALASIGSVSFAKLISRTNDSNEAFEIQNRAGSIGDLHACAAPVGTRVEVRDLFFNVPARQKFLKSAGTETGHIADAMLRAALVHPDVSFKLVSGGRVNFDLPVSDPITRWLEAWPADFAQQKLDIHARDAELSLIGVIGKPELAQPYTRHQFFYVNRRFVRDKSIAHALKESFRGLVEPGRNPACVLSLTIPPDQVDVNVHPTKIEVRFRDSQRIHGFVLSSVRELLLTNDISPRLAINQNTGWRSTNFESTENDSLRQRLAEFFKSGATSTSSDNTGTFASSPQTRLPDVTSTQPDAAPEGADYGSTSQSTALVSSPIAPAIQLHNSYLVVESDEGMIIIDQHALHERILFEEILDRLQRGPLESQRLLLPIPISVTAQQAEAHESLTPIFEKLGIETTLSGPTSVAVHSFPSFLERLDAGEFVKDALERAEREDRIDHEALLRDVLDMMSCKAAVKAGDPLTADEIRALLQRRHLVSRSSNCPHGRPTTLRVSLKDLEKQFKRTGF